MRPLNPRRLTTSRPIRRDRHALVVGDLNVTAEAVLARHRADLAAGEVGDHDAVRDVGVVADDLVLAALDQRLKDEVTRVGLERWRQGLQLGMGCHTDRLLGPDVEMRQPRAEPVGPEAGLHDAREAAPAADARIARRGALR